MIIICQINHSMKFIQIDNPKFIFTANIFFLIFSNKITNLMY